MNKFYKVIYGILWVLAKLFFPWESTGAQNVPESGGAVVCANHTSFLDPILLMLAATGKRQFRIIAKAELFKGPVLGWILKNMGVIPVKRGMSDISAIKEGLRVLKNGELLLIFPEGTRVREGKQAHAHPGAIVLAGRAGVPVQPVYIGAKKRMFRKTRVVFGEPYDLEFEGRKPTHDENRALKEVLMERIRALGEEA